MSQKSDITLYFLNASRAIRIGWILEELKLPYNVVASNRAPSGLAPPEFKKKIPAPLGKSPTIKDGDLVVQESGAIVEYLCETYDKDHRLLPSDVKQRSKVREWINAAEGTFMVHCLAILYARWNLPKEAHSYLPAMEASLCNNVHNDLNWLEAELSGPTNTSGGKYLVGNSITAADIMLHFSIQFLYARNLGVDADGKGLGKDESPTKGKKWEAVEKWFRGLEASDPSYLKAVENCGYVL